MKMTDTYKVTPYLGSALPTTPEYRNMIVSKWLRSLKYGNDYFKLIDSECYYKNYPKYIELILNRPLTVVRIAALTDNPDVALGFSVSEKETVHYVYCHKDHRRTGVGSSLMPPSVNTITHLTHD